MESYLTELKGSTFFCQMVTLWLIPLKLSYFPYNVVSFLFSGGFIAFFVVFSPSHAFNALVLHPINNIPFAPFHVLWWKIVQIVFNGQWRWFIGTCVQGSSKFLRIIVAFSMVSDFFRLFVKDIFRGLIKFGIFHEFCSSWIKYLGLSAFFKSAFERCLCVLLYIDNIKTMGIGMGFSEKTKLSTVSIPQFLYG